MDALDTVEEVLKPTPQRLSKAALEVLALIAYHQPITQAELEAMHGKRLESLEDLLPWRKALRFSFDKP
ncbi:MAG: SMC-Scp complex subunit ScpB [Thermaceae bacterium]